MEDFFLTFLTLINNRIPDIFHFLESGLEFFLFSFRLTLYNSIAKRYNEW